MQHQAAFVEFQAIFAQFIHKVFLSTSEEDKKFNIRVVLIQAQMSIIKMFANFCPYAMYDFMWFYLYIIQFRSVAASLKPHEHLIAVCTFKKQSQDLFRPITSLLSYIIIGCILSTVHLYAKPIEIKLIYPLRLIKNENV